MQWVGSGILLFGIFQSTTELIDIRGYLEQLLQYRQDEYSRQAESMLSGDVLSYV